MGAETMNADQTGAPAPTAPPAPDPTTTTHDPLARADLNAAWKTLMTHDSSDDDTRRACQILIANCRDPRRDTARDILAVLGDGE